MTLIYSLLVIFAILGNAAVPEMMFVNATDFGVLIIGYAAAVVLSAVVAFVLKSKNGKNSPILSELLPHGAIVLSVAVLTLAITNLFNRTMSFVSSEMSILFILIYAMFGLFLAIRDIECLIEECEE